MIAGTLTLWAAALVLGLLVVRRAGRPAAMAASEEAGDQFTTLFLRLIAAIVFAGFAAALLPETLIARLLGAQSGMAGVALAIVLGAVMPGGLFVAFPIAAAAWRLGVGPVQMVAFITAWSTLALHRVIAFEVPLIGGRLAAVRLTASLVLPLVAAALSAALLLVLPTPGA